MPIRSSPSPTALLLAASLALIALVEVNGGCVGAVAGIPVHLAGDGAKARNAMLPALLQARASASSLLPNSIFVALGDRVFHVDASGSMTLLAGTGSQRPRAGAPVIGTAASLVGPLIAPSRAGLLYMSDWRGSISSFNLLDGELSLVAGDPSAGLGWSPDATPASSALIGAPSCLEVALNGDIYYCEAASAETATVVRVIRAAGPRAGLIETVAGNGSFAYAQEGALARLSGFSYIVDAFYDDASGSLLVAENGPWVLHGFISNAQVTRVGPDGVVHVLAGNVSSPWSNWFVSGTPALSASLSFLTSVCTGPAGDGAIYFSEQPRVARLGSNGILTVLTGQAPAPITSYTWAVFVDGAPASTASLGDVYRVRPDDAFGAIVITDVAASTVYRLFPSTGAMETVAGRTLQVAPTPGVRPLATQAGFPSPNDVDVDPVTGDIYGALSPSNVIVRLSVKSGILAVVAGTGEYGCGPDNVTDATTAALAVPYCSSLDGRGGLLICDYANCLIRLLDLASGSMRVVAGDVASRCAASTSTDALAPSADVPPGTTEVPSAYIGSPNFVASDPATGDVFFTEYYPARVMVVRAATGLVFRIAGVGRFGEAPEGPTALNLPLQGPYTIK